MATIPPAKRTTRMGLISLGLALIVGISWCLYSVFAANLLKQSLGTSSAAYGASSIANSGLLVSAVTAALSAAGIVLTVLALRTKEPKPGFAIAGGVLNALYLAGFLLLLLLGALSTG